MQDPELDELLATSTWVLDDVPQFGGFDVASNIHLVPDGHTTSEVYGFHFQRFRASIGGLSDVSFEEAPAVIVLILDHILQHTLDHVDDRDFVRLRIESGSLHYPIWTPPMWKSQLTVDRWMEEVRRVLNSQDEFRMDEKFFIVVEHARPPTGGCKDKVPDFLAEKFHKMHSVVQIKNEDSLCMARALAVGRALVDGDRRLHDKLRCHMKAQTYAAEQLIRQARLPYREYSTADLKHFEKVMPGYQLSVISTSHLLSIIHKGTPSDKRIILLHHDGHFNLLKSYNFILSHIIKFLGQLTDELKPGQWIVEFASLGPNSYAYVTNDGKTAVRIKGFALNGETSKLINSQSILEMLQTKSIVTVPYRNLITRNQRKLELDEIVLQNKRCRYTYDKRVVIDAEYNTKPYGTC